MMLSSQSVTSFARDRRELMWIGTSAGLNVYDGKSYIQFGYDVKDTAALPDDYINVLHLDRKGRMWVGTQNGLARYVGAYRFHRVALPAHHHNIIAIEDSPEKHDSLAILVSDGNQTYRIGGDEKITPSSHSIQPNNLQAPLPADLSILRKPVEVVTATFCDLGGNLWVGYRNAGVQIISQNRIAYKKQMPMPYLIKPRASLFSRWLLWADRCWQVQPFVFLLMMRRIAGWNRRCLGIYSILCQSPIRST